MKENIKPSSGDVPDPPTVDLSPFAKITTQKVNANGDWMENGSSGANGDGVGNRGRRNGWPSWI